MSLEYDRKIAQKLRNIDKKYVESEDRKELVGGNVRELVDVKEGMGLEGMGLSAGMKKVLRKTKGKGMSAGAQLGYDGPPVWKDNEVPPFFRAGSKSAGGMSGGFGLLDIAKIPLKLIGLGKDGEEYEMSGNGLFDIMNPIKMIKLARMALGDSEHGSGYSAGGMSGGFGLLDIAKIPLKLMGLGKDGEEYELEGSGAFVDAIKNFLMNLHPLMIAKKHIKSELKKGRGVSAGSVACGMSAGRKRRGKGVSAGGLPEVPTSVSDMSGGKRGRKQSKIIKGMSAGAVNRTGNQGLMGYGDVPQEGAGLMDIVGKVINGPSDFLNKLNPMSFSSPIEDMVGRDRLRKISGSIVQNMMGLGSKKKGKGMGGRPTTQNMPSSSFSGGAKKPNKRAEIVKKVMRERGVSMIQASKIVKSEGLY